MELASQVTTGIALPFTGTLSQGLVVVADASNAYGVKLPATMRERPVGIVNRPDGSSLVGTTGKAIDIQCTGLARVRVLTGVSISPGDELVVANTSGEVTKRSGITPAGTIFVGTALSTVSTAASGQMVLCALDLGNIPGVAKFTSDSAILANSAVVFSPDTNNRVKAPAGADPVSAVAGVALTAATGAGEEIEVCTHGPALLTAGTSWSRQDRIAIKGTGGDGKPVAVGAGANSMLIGHAMAATTAPATGLVFVSPDLYQAA